METTKGGQPLSDRAEKNIPNAMLVLQETPAGFALFSVADKKIQQADKVRRAVQRESESLGMRARSRCRPGLRRFRA